MKLKIRKFYKAVMRELRENRGTFLVYIGLRAMVILVMILQLFNRNYENVFLCILTLGLMILPSVFQATLKIELPSMLEIILLIFIFAAEILGEISSFYIKFRYWDTVLHTINGFLCAAVGFSLVDIMNRQKKLKFELSPSFMAIMAFCFSMTIGVLWEFFEFGMDMVFDLDMQKDTVISEINSTYLDPENDNNCISIIGIDRVIVNDEQLNITGYLDIGLIDTMYDMMVNFIGAFLFSILGYWYIKRRDDSSVIKGLVPEPWSEEKLYNERE